VKGLDGRVVLVTGAASGIGRAVAKRLAGEGARLALVDRDDDGIAEVADELHEIGTRTMTATLDVSRATELAAAVELAARELGGLYGLVTSAGVFEAGDLRPVAEVEVEAFERVLAVNLEGTFLPIKYALPHMEKNGGSIVTIASTAGLRGHGFGSGYTASKGGVIALTRLVAFQYAAAGIRCNCVCPGYTDTPMAGGAHEDPEFGRQLLAGIPMARIGKPDDIAGAVCYLLSDDASYISGQIIAVDGAATIR
jgi:NAD(P)-dependent dehydrogenase (short-subunit alcohol dehydrogenase family)